MATALVTLDDVKNYFGVIGSNASDDDLIEELIERVSFDFTHFCGRDSFLASNYTEYVDGNGTNKMYLKNTPINSITSIYEDQEWIWGDEDIVASADYRVTDLNIIYVDKWLIGDQNYKVTYNGGYSTVPLDLVQCCVEEVVRKFKHRKDFEILSRTLEDGSSSYVPIGYLQSTFRVLTRYRRMRAN